MHHIRLSSLSNVLVFFDFDNTVTLFDLLDDLIKHFSINKEWVALEEAWAAGKIGSRKCLEGQLKGVRVTKKELVKYLSYVRIDPGFHKVHDLLRKEGITPVILSDNFTFIINTILKNNGIKGAKVFANSLRIKGDRLFPSFPHTNLHCLRCAHCKKKNLQKKGIRDKLILYVGDGLSDICPAECSDTVFAKGKLLQHFRKTKRLCVAFDTQEDIYNYFRGLDNEQ